MLFPRSMDYFQIFTGYDYSNNNQVNLFLNISYFGLDEYFLFFSIFIIAFGSIYAVNVIITQTYQDSVFVNVFF